ncbi:MAG: FKBP-type peptidyl-prolyl cis-trans isomerase [Flavobacteriales bacterium]|nr:FKBP-type peptidyl-prolyl cis-trans isomerase [Flavobacteriales bacterium]
MKKYIFLGTISFFITSCMNSQEKKNEMSQQQIKEALIDVNKKAIEQESIQIDGYINRRNWDVVKTGTGLRYQIYKNGSGMMAKPGMKAIVEYELSLINGDIIYSTKEKGAEQFTIGEDHVESGLHEAICYLKVGDKARIIIPSHLAHGLVGDFKKIPIRSTIIYDLELKELK